MMTHNDAGSTACCVAFIGILWDLLQMTSPPAPIWWLKRYMEIASQLEGNREYASRAPAYNTFRGPIHRFVEESVRAAHQDNLPVVDACNRWQSGTYLMETMPSVIYILMRHGHDPEEAIVRAVNDTWDNDTIAAIVGAAVGALHGQNAIPQRWIANHSGRTAEGDDGKMFQLIREAGQRWGDTD